MGKLSKKRALAQDAKKKKVKDHDIYKTKRGRSFNRQLQRAVCDVFRYFEKERLNERPLHNVVYSRKRTMEALQISEKTFYKYWKKGKDGAKLETPGKVRAREKKITDVDSFVANAIREVIYEYARKRKHISLEILLAQIRERKIDFEGSLESLRKVLFKLGFEYGVTDTTKYLVEQPCITMRRIAFLRKYMENKNSPDGLPVIFTDETWEYQAGTARRRRWADRDRCSSLNCGSSRGPRFIICHAGGRQGFVPNASLFVRSSLAPKEGDDYHGDMKGNLSHKWFKEDLLPNLREPSLIVLDNASYHSVQA